MDFSQMLDSAWKSEHRHILVSGESGSGKTSFLKNIACELEESIPIYIDLSAVNGDNYISKTILKEYCGYTEFEDTETVLENKLISILNEPADSSAKYVLLLDGIDEIPSWFTCNLCKELEMLAGCSGAQIVLAANSMNTVRANFFFEKLDCFSEYYVQPLSDDAVRQALEKRNIDYNGISDSVKVLLSRPYFLHGFIQLAENGSDVSKVGSAFDLYSAIVKHDIRIIGKRDGRLGSAEYALEKLLPALSSRLDRVAFDYTTLKSALKTAFLDTSYSNPGLDGISDALLARIKQNNNSNEHQLLEETAYDGIFNHYLNKVFLDRHYLVKTDDSHYRFCHSTWFQFFQIKHLVNEINKTDNKSIPNTVPEEQAERYFGDIKKAEKRISAEGLEPVAKQAFQKTISGKAKKRDKSKKIERLSGLCVFMILMCIILVGVIRQVEIPWFHFTLTPTEKTVDEHGKIVDVTESPIPTMSPIPATTLARNMGPFSSGLFTFINGETITIPDGFVDSNVIGIYKPNPDVEQYNYDFYDKETDMHILLSEASEETLLQAYEKGYSLSPYRDLPLKVKGDLLDALYEDEFTYRPSPVYFEKSLDSYVITGYADDNIYYTRVCSVEGVVYSISFLYPVANRDTCDRIVERVESSFSGIMDTEQSNSSFQSNTSTKPSSADLDAIGANITYPASESMYLDSYRYCKVQSSPGREAVYSFINPGLGQADGNYYTVYNDTEVIVLAESNGYSCGIIPSLNKAGWIISTFLSPTS